MVSPSLNLKIEKEIALIEFDQPDSTINVLNTGTMREFSRIIDKLSEISMDIKALIVTSKKDGIFIAGADIKEIEGINSVEEAKEKARKGKEILKALHNLDLISVAMINGVCVGGGLELALACKYRVASFSERVKIGLPEVKLGLLPGWGGTQRLPKIVGIQQALDMILSGRLISGKEALKNGLVDRLFPESRLIEESINFVYALLEKRQVIKKTKKRRFLQRFLEDTPLGRDILFKQASKEVLKRTKGFYPAPVKTLQLIKNTYGRDINKGFLKENDVFSELVVTDISKNLIKVFYLDTEFKKFPWVDKRIKPALVNKCGIVGAGVMGGGIAQLISYNDISVRIKDINYEVLKRALRTAYKLFKYALKKKKLKRHQVDYKFGLISPTLAYKGFENADMVIEAVIEDLAVKQKVFEELNQIVSSHTVLASNTSSLSIRKLAEVSNSPEKVVGLHFFNPVHRMPLVEVIRSYKTSEETLATVIAFVRKMKKVVIVVKDVPGFLINRVLFPYLNEAGFLMEDGMAIEDIDEVMRRFGMPMGPLELIDEIGIDVGYKVSKILQDAYGKRMKTPCILKQVKDKGLWGKKIGIGFYIHKGKKKVPNKDIYNLCKTTMRRALSSDDAVKRMLYVMVNEAARCLEEGVVEMSKTIDIGMIMGIGFPPFRAGLLRYADREGMDNIVRELEGFEERLGDERFSPCDYLRDMAEKNKSFYS